MILPVFFQGGLFLGTIAAGFTLAFSYDIFRMMRRIIPHKALFIHVEDFLYWIAVVILMFWFLLASNSGEVRFFAIAGAFLGMFIYFKMVSHIFLKFSVAIYEAVKKFVLLFLSIILAPFKTLLYLLSFPVAYLTKKARLAYAYEKRLYTGMKIRSRKKTEKIKRDFKIILKKF